MKRYRSMLSIAYLCLLLAAASRAQSQPSSTAEASSTASIPHLVRFSGNVKDDAGHARSGVVGITFALYKDEQGGAPLWLETQNVQADSKGNYTVLLGSTNTDGLPTDIFASNEARWLGVHVEGQEEQPRKLLVSAGAEQEQQCARYDTSDRAAERNPLFGQRGLQDRLPSQVRE